MTRTKLSVTAQALSIAVSLVGFSSAALAQQPAAPDPPHRDWRASWVTHPTAPLREPIVLHFRRELEVASAPATFIVRVSADNRFALYVNGQQSGCRRSPA